MTDKEKLKLKIEEQRQLIRPKNTGEMKVADIPTPLEQGWLNALKWMDELVDSLPKESTTEQDSELEEEIKKEYKKMFGNNETIRITSLGFVGIARHFAEWQKVQMMKGAVKMDIMGYGTGWLSLGFLSECEHDFKKDDKVKVIIVKED